MTIPLPRIALVLWLGLSITVATATEAPPGATVESLLTVARTNSPDYQVARQEADAAEMRVTPAGALPDPRLRTEWMDITKGGTQSASLNPSQVSSTRYVLMQELPWFGKRDLRRNIAELDARSAQERAEANWQDLAARIKATYAQLYYLTRSKKYNHELLDLLARLEKVALARYASGLAAQQDVIRAQVEQTTLRNELITLETEHHHLHTRMNALLGRPALAPLSPPIQARQLPPPAALNYAALEETVRAHNPALIAEESRLQASEKGRDLVYKNRYPDLTVGMIPNQFQNTVKQWDFMVEVSIPLQQSSRRAQEREAESMLAAAQSRRDATANQVLAELAENLAALEAAQRIETLTTTSLLPQAELTFKAALVGYETGKVDFATLLDAHKQTRLARLNQLKAQAEGQIRLADLERIVGNDL